MKLLPVFWRYQVKRGVSRFARSVELVLAGRRNEVELERILLPDWVSVDFLGALSVSYRVIDENQHEKIDGTCD